MTTGTLEPLIRRANEALAHAVDPGDADRRSWMIDFGHVVGEMGRLVVRVPSLEDAVQQLAADTASRVADAPLGYRRALGMRSDLQFLVDLYAVGDVIASPDLEVIDAALERLAPEYYVGPVPDDIPRHHVWWQRHASER